MTRFLENIMPSTKQIWRTESTCQFEKRVQIRLFNIKLQGLADTNKCFNFDAKKKKTCWNYSGLCTTKQIEHVEDIFPLSVLTLTLAIRIHKVTQSCISACQVNPGFCLHVWWCWQHLDHIALLPQKMTPMSVTSQSDTLSNYTRVRSQCSCLATYQSSKALNWIHLNIKDCCPTA